MKARENMQTSTRNTKRGTSPSGRWQGYDYRWHPSAMAIQTGTFQTAKVQTMTINGRDVAYAVDPTAGIVWVVARSEHEAPVDLVRAAFVRHGGPKDYSVEIEWSEPIPGGPVPGSVTTEQALAEITRWAMAAVERGASLAEVRRAVFAGIGLD